MLWFSSWQYPQRIIIDQSRAFFPLLEIDQIYFNQVKLILLFLFLILREQSLNSSLCKLSGTLGHIHDLLC